MGHPSSNGRDEFRVDYRKYESPSRAIVIAIAALENTDATELPPLHESVDPDALDQLLRHAEGTERPVVVELTIDGYAIRIRSNGTLQIADTPSQSGSS